MRVPRYLMGVVAVFLWIVVVLMFYFRSPLGPWLRLKSLERQVANIESNVNPTELRQWADNLLARDPRELQHYQDFYGTNLPPGLKSACVRLHDVEIHQSGGEQFFIIISSGSKGGLLLCVDSPTFLTPNGRTIIPWKPGIYFAGVEGY